MLRAGRDELEPLLHALQSSGDPVDLLPSAAALHRGAVACKRAGGLHLHSERLPRVDPPRDEPDLAEGWRSEADRPSGEVRLSPADGSELRMLEQDDAGLRCTARCDLRL